MKRIVLLGITLLLIVSIVSANQVIQGSFTTESEWEVISKTGSEENFTVIFTDLKDKKTDICFVLDYGTDPFSVDLSDRYLFNKDGSLLYDNKNKSIKLKYESSKCNGVDGYHISLTNAQAINIDDYIKFGYNSIQIEFGNISVGVFNNTNSSAGYVQIVDLSQNGSYTGTVISLNDSYNSANITANTTSWSGFEVEGRVRTSTAPINEDDQYIYSNMLGGSVQVFNKYGNTFTQFGAISTGDSFSFETDGIKLVVVNDGQQRGYCYRTADVFNCSASGGCTSIAKFSIPNANGQVMAPFGHSDEFRSGPTLKISTTGQLQAFLVDSGGKSIGASIMENNVFYTAGTRINQTGCGDNCEYWDLWIDGKINATRTDIDEIYNANKVYLGCADESSNLAFNGTIAWGVFFNKTLNDTEIKKWTNGTYDLGMYTDYQTFNNGLDTPTFNISNQSTLVQFNELQKSNGTDTATLNSYTLTAFNAEAAGPPPPSDTTPPAYSNIVTNISNNSAYFQTQGYQFNITWNDATTLMDKVFFELNGTNFSITKQGNIYSYNASQLSAGDYFYRWWANDTVGNSNQTDLLLYKIQQASTQLSLLLNGSGDNLSFNITKDINITCILNVSGALEIFQDDVSIATGASPLTTIETYSSSGNFTINCTFLENQNYTSSFNLSSIEAAGQDTQAPLIIDAPFNYTNTNTSIFWNVSFNEIANITGTWGNGSSAIGNGVFTNLSFLLVQNFSFLTLTNNTPYHFNITSFCDAFGNCNNTGFNFTFTTGQNFVPAPTTVSFTNYAWIIRNDTSVTINAWASKAGHLYTKFLNTSAGIISNAWAGSYTNGEAYACFDDNGTLFAKDSACD